MPRLEHLIFFVHRKDLHQARLLMQGCTASFEDFFPLEMTSDDDLRISLPALECGVPEHGFFHVLFPSVFPHDRFQALVGSVAWKAPERAGLLFVGDGGFAFFRLSRYITLSVEAIRVQVN